MYFTPSGQTVVSTKNQVKYHFKRVKEGEWPTIDYFVQSVNGIWYVEINDNWTENTCTYYQLLPLQSKKLHLQTCDRNHQHTQTILLPSMEKTFS